MQEQALKQNQKGNIEDTKSDFINLVKPDDNSDKAKMKLAKHVKFLTDTLAERNLIIATTDNKFLSEAQRAGIIYHGIDTLSLMADEILNLRSALAAMTKSNEINETTKQIVTTKNAVLNASLSIATKILRKILLNPTEAQKIMGKYDITIDTLNDGLMQKIAYEIYAIPAGETTDYTATQELICLQPDTKDQHQNTGGQQ